MTGRTLMYDVASLVLHKGQATVEDLIPHFEGKTVYQIRKALHNAVAKGIIKCLHNGHRIGGHGCGPATYGSKDAKALGASAPVVERRKAPVSVFGVWASVPTETGTRHSPLGGWD